MHAIETLLLYALAEAVQAAARLLFFAGALFLLSWKLALASLIVDPAVLLRRRRNFARLARRAARERRRRSGSLGAVAEEALANTALVQTANAQERELERFRRENEGAMAAELAGTRIAGLFAPIIDLIELAGAMLDHRPGHLGAERRRLTIGGLLAFLAYLAQLYRPVRDLSRLGQQIFEAHGRRRAGDRAARHRAARARAPGARAARARPRRARARRRPSPTRARRARRSPASTSRVAPGRSVALVGASGAGKSTARQARAALPRP